MFVSDEAWLDVSFPAARARLTHLIRGGLLASASAQAYSDGITGLARLLHVHARDLAARGDSARLALRWEAAGPGGALFPALDADITLTAAREHSATLTLTGAYRPPPGTGLDLEFVRQVAFLDRVTGAIADPARAAGRQPGAAGPEPSPLPPRPSAP